MDNNSTMQDIQFITRHYRKGCFNVNNGWKRLSLARPSWWRSYRVAAAIGGLVILSATATVIYHQYDLKNTPVETVQENVRATEVVKVIDFEDTPLPTVISKIKEVYGVEVVNIPDNADGYHLSLHYEGNAVDLVATINDILETHMEVEE